MSKRLKLDFLKERVNILERAFADDVVLIAGSEKDS